MHDSSGSLFPDLVFWLFKYARDGTNRFVGDLRLFELNSFGVGEDNQATMVGIIHFLLSIQLAAIVNEISRAVISGEGFRYSLCPVIIPPLWKERSSRDP